MADPYSMPARTPALYEPDASPASVRTVPFDYVVTFDLAGTPGRVVSNVINVSTVGTFVVTAIGYSLLKAARRVGPVDVDDPERPVTPDPPVVIPPSTPPVIITAAPGGANGGGDEVGSGGADAPPPEPATRFQIIGVPGSRVQVLVNGTVAPPGTRELDAQGRLLIDPDDLALGTLDALVVNDLTSGQTGSTIQVDRRASTDAPLVSPQFGPGVPFPGATRLDVAGTPGQDVDVAVYGAAGADAPRLRGVVSLPSKDEPDAGVRAGRLAVDLQTLMEGEAFARSRRKVKLRTDKEIAEAVASAEKPYEPPRLAAGDTIVLRNAANNFSASHTIPSGVLNQSLASLPVRALRQGFRVNPLVLNRLEHEVPPTADELQNAFELCGADPGDVSFLYSIIDNGTGRALQSEPIHNVAGLGIADGDRPFRTYPRPIVFEPRSVILFQIQEHSGGPGTLYIVLQGYKVIGTGRRRLIE